MSSFKPIILDVECIVCNKSLQKINHDPREVSRKMGKIVIRRSRTPNWSVDEKQYLLELINERKAVITKSTNGPTHYEEKDVAWNEILSALGKRFGNKFQGSSLKKVKTQWQNMKRIAREEISLNGPDIQKYTRQSLQVCSILDMVKDGELQSERLSNNLNETVVSNNIPNIEIKAERIDEDNNQPNCSISNLMDTDMEPLQEPTQNFENESNEINQFDSSSSSSEPPEFEPQEECSRLQTQNVSSNTEFRYEDASCNTSPLHDYQEFVRFTSAEKKLKMETMQEERQVMRAMRETAELNKIIAEQRLKHVLWVKRTEVAMYVGEPGSGAGAGGGGGGSIREAGGAFGKMEAAREDQYFYKKQKEQLENIRKHVDKEISFHQEQIKRHEEAILRHKKSLTDSHNK